jgi:hypothetical protein
MRVASSLGWHFVASLAQDEQLNFAQAIGICYARRTKDEHDWNPPDVRFGRGGSMLKAYRYKLKPNKSQPETSQSNASQQNLPEKGQAKAVRVRNFGWLR